MALIAARLNAGDILVVTVYLSLPPPPYPLSPFSPDLISIMVGSHDRRSLQLSPKMYYYASLTLRSETTLPLKNHSTYVKNNHTME